MATVNECRAQGTFSGNATSAVIPGRMRDRLSVDRIDIHITGTWGSGTATLKYSIDGGTTLVAVPVDKDANLVTLTSDGVMTVKARYPALYIVLTGSTTPTLTWIAF